jgi:cytoskeletal protein CcmA (bactofilin family)
VSDDPTHATVVDEGTSLAGTLTATTPVIVMGRLEGEVSGPTVEVTPSGVLHGTVKATTLRSQGELGGHFEADDVELAGRVLDDTVIRAKALQVSFSGDVGMVFGACELEIGEAPDKAGAVREANAARRPRPVEPPPGAVPADPAPPTTTSEL